MNFSSKPKTVYVDVRIKIEGLTHGVCSTLEKTITSVRGVKAASISLRTGIATVYADATINHSHIISRLESAGYEGSIVSKNPLPGIDISSAAGDHFFGDTSN